jgi:hypothetical protein
MACLFLSAVTCRQKSEENGSDQTHPEEEQGANQALYEEVMGIHDEVMPKMNDLYKRKTALKTRLELPGISENEMQEIHQKIARIDSSSESMMVWMREFDPVPDSEGEEEARTYLEEELVKVKKVREDILEALKTTE